MLHGQIVAVEIRSDRHQTKLLYKLDVVIQKSELELERGLVYKQFEVFIN